MVICSYCKEQRTDHDMLRVVKGHVVPGKKCIHCRNEFDAVVKELCDKYLYNKGTYRAHTPKRKGAKNA